MHCKSYSHFFSKKFQHICVSLNVNFNESLTNVIVSFEQLGRDICGCQFRESWYLRCTRQRFSLKIYLSCNVKKMYLLTVAHMEDSDQPARPRSLISVFVVRIKTLCIRGYPTFAQWVNSFIAVYLLSVKHY